MINDSINDPSTMLLIRLLRDLIAKSNYFQLLDYLKIVFSLNTYFLI